jgi:2OG-Fe(II) oxygenase superfamily
MKEEILRDAVSSIEFFLDPTISGDERLLRQISDHLIAGNLVVIRDAFQAGFAERMFECLNSFSNWTLYEGYEEHFHYRHHNIYDERLFPDPLKRCHDVFASEPTKSFINHLSQQDCTGKVVFSASLYRPGDHSLPHNDLKIHDGEQRQVAFVWNLTKGWRADWGGEFLWCKKSTAVEPAFNSLLLFNVDPGSMHFVTMVAPQAQSKRLAISGWWTGQRGLANRETQATKSQADETRVQII